jgi:hypothetical protein
MAANFYLTQLGKTGSAANRYALRFRSFAFAQELASQQAYYDGEQGRTLYEGRRNDHVVTDITYSFWLASDSFHGT